MLVLDVNETLLFGPTQIFWKENLEKFNDWDEKEKTKNKILGKIKIYFDENLS